MRCKNEEIQDENSEIQDENAEIQDAKRCTSPMRKWAAIARQETAAAVTVTYLKWQC